jgi:hypothetical protein
MVFGAFPSMAGSGKRKCSKGKWKEGVKQSGGKESMEVKRRGRGKGTQ